LLFDVQNTIDPWGIFILYTLDKCTTPFVECCQLLRGATGDVFSVGGHRHGHALDGGANDLLAVRGRDIDRVPLPENPTLMRPRELEVLEKIIANGNLRIVLGETNFADRVMNLI
jgi:hypothetical protein